MTHPEDPVQTLEAEACWRFLAEQQVGRLAVAIGGEPYVFPINHIVDEGSLLFRTGEGSKLLAVALGGRVSYEVDAWTGREGTSVVVRGTAHELEGDERSRAESLGLRPWVPTTKTHYVRIDVDAITGRHFTFGPEPTPWHPEP